MLGRCISPGEDGNSLDVELPRSFAYANLRCMTSVLHVPPRKWFRRWQNNHTYRDLAAIRYQQRLQLVHGRARPDVLANLTALYHIAARIGRIRR